MLQIRIDQTRLFAILQTFGIHIEEEQPRTPTVSSSPSIPMAPAFVQQQPAAPLQPHMQGVQLQTQAEPVAKHVQNIPSMQIPRVAPQQPAATNGVAAELDVKGVAWDSKIHSSSKSKNKDGTWRVKRNLDPNIAATIGSQQPSPTVAAAPVPFASPAFIPVSAPINVQPLQQPAPVQYVDPAPVPMQQASFSPPPVHHVPPQAVASPQSGYIVGGEMLTKNQLEHTIPGAVGNDVKYDPSLNGVHAHTFQSFHANLVPLFGALIKEGKIDQNYINSLKDYFKASEIWDIMNDQNKMLELYNTFCDSGLIRRLEA